MRTELPFYIREEDPPAKREILRAALRLFSRQGLAATSIRDIAEVSGYTNPALYKHFPSKDALAQYLFETCHARVWTTCAEALDSAEDFTARLDAYVAAWLGLLDNEADALAFLADSARVLWPRAGAEVQRRTMIGLAQALMADAPGVRAGRIDKDAAAAAVEGTLAELGRMIQVGVVPGPARAWHGKMTGLFRQLAG